MINILYSNLLEQHGPQGWWPIVDMRLKDARYHLSTPRNDSDVFEIAVGAVLTQNIAWKNVVTAMVNLKQKRLLTAGAIIDAAHEEIAELIRPSGYYNQKTKKLKELSQWFIDRKSLVRSVSRYDAPVLREELLSITGIGPETADSILLYAFNKKIFVVDAYTRRILSRIGTLEGTETYHEIQSLFHENFTRGIGEYREYHALLVAHGKDVCTKTPCCSDCCLVSRCSEARIF